MNKVNIICLKWGDKYPAEDVNRLFGMVSKNLNRPFDFFCITEDSTGFDERINVLPLYDVSLSGWWHKLTIFRKDFYGLSGTALFLDLDIVITAEIDTLFDYKPGQACSVRDYGKCRWGVINSSVVRFEIGHLDYVWQGFLANKEWIVENMHGDQDWLGRVAPAIELYPSDWVISFKKHCNAKGKKVFGIGRWLMENSYLKPSGEAELPKTAKIVLFHGKPDPIDVAYQPYKQWKKATWIQKFWML